MKNILILSFCIILVTVSRSQGVIPITYDTNVYLSAETHSSGMSDFAEYTGVNDANVSVFAEETIPQEPWLLHASLHSTFEALGLSNGGQLNWDIVLHGEEWIITDYQSDVVVNGTFTVGTDGNHPFDAALQIEIIPQFQPYPEISTELFINDDVIWIGDYNESYLLDVYAGHTYDILFRGNQRYNGIGPIGGYLDMTVITEPITYGGGSGTSSDPYLIYTAEQMQAIGADSNDWDKYFKLMADIDLSGYTGTQYNIIGDYNTQFIGVFDGNGHTISNFTYDSNGTDYIGLFGYINHPDAEIKKLTLVDCNIYAGTAEYVGSLVGRLEYGGIITECYSLGGNVSGGNGSRTFGGLCGFNAGLIRYCYTSGIVSGGDNSVYLGGLCGENHNNGSINNCYTMAIVSGGNNSLYLGGLCGKNYNRIENCYATGIVTGSNYVGGICGFNSYLVIDCFWDIETSGITVSDGGTGKTSVEMKQKDTFLNWDFSETWGIVNNQTYPFLRLLYPVGDLDFDGDVDFIDFEYLASNWLEGK